MAALVSGALPPASVATMCWRLRDALYAGVVVKAAFRLVVGGRMTPLEAPPVEHEGRHHRGSPARSLVYPSDVVPYRANADLLVQGKAFPSGEGGAVNVRVALVDDLGRSAVDKELTVVTDGEPVELVGENTLVGDDNPHGVRDAAEARVRYPDGRDAPASFGPTSPFAASRSHLPGAKLGGSFGRRAKEGTIVELPDDVDWSVFQAAPLDQRAPFFGGDEWLVLHHLHPELPEMRCRLPVERGHAFVAAHPADVSPHYAQWHPVHLAADTLIVDPENLRAVMVWRGHLQVDPPTLLGALRIVGGVAEVFDVAQLPAPADLQGREAPAPAAPFDSSSTRTLGVDGQALAAARAMVANPYKQAKHTTTLDGGAIVDEESVVPFELAEPGAAREVGAIPGAPWNGADAAPPVAAPLDGAHTADSLGGDDGPDPFGQGTATDTTPVASTEVEPPPVEAPAVLEPEPDDEPPARAPEVLRAEPWRDAGEPAPKSEVVAPPPPAPKAPPRPPVVDVQSKFYGRFS